MINPSELDVYFRQLAISALDHSDDEQRFTYNTDHFSDAQRSELALDNPTMILDDPRGTMHYNGGTWRSVTTHGFWIVRRLENTDWERQNVVVGLCNTKALDILRLMIVNYEDQDGVMGHLIPDSIDFKAVGPLQNNCFGVYYSYSLRTPQTLN
ncbi:MAG: hypothetical protein MJH10_11875 [Epibacterium sp.]|nr:hypothetical protein [Epibacterium sp.]NQX74245.1 hypothetical protein [Epibacterium sp.]